jgi:hypothetical protein
MANEEDRALDRHFDLGALFNTIPLIVLTSKPA